MTKLCRVLNYSIFIFVSLEGIQAISDSEDICSVSFVIKYDQEETK